MSAIREALEEAFDHHEAIANEEEASDSPPAGKTRVVPAANDGLGAEEPIDDVVVKPTNPRERKLDGKFAPGKKGAGDANALPQDEPGKPQEPKTPVVKDPLQQQQTQAKKPAEESPYKAPVSWRPERRESFASLPREVQEEVTRRETEMSRFVEQTSQARNYATAINNELAPFQAMIRAEGGNDVTAVRSLLQTAYHLRTANPQAKAQMVAQMILQHGIDPNLLDQSLAAALQGRQAQPQNDPTMSYVQQQLKPIQDFFGQLQQRQQQVEQDLSRQVQTDLATFAADPKNEFYADVSPIMGDILATATANGMQMSLQDAYTRATLAHPSISTIVMNRQMSQRGAQQTAATRRARNASASLPSGGAPSGAADAGTKPANRRSALEAAWEQVEDREV